jgi:hypothetical protein
VVEFTPSCLALRLSSCVAMGALAAMGVRPLSTPGSCAGDEAFRATPHLFLGTFGVE